MSLKTIFNKWATDHAPLHDVATAGVIVCRSVHGSGFPQGDAGATFRLAASSSGAKPVGLLTQNFIVLDESLHKKNYWNNEQTTGNMAEAIRRGVVMTDLIAGTAPIAGDPAYLSSSGYVTKTNLGSVATPLIGEFKSNVDVSGFVKLEINLP